MTGMVTGLIGAITITVIGGVVPVIVTEAGIVTQIIAQAVVITITQGDIGKIISGLEETTALVGASVIIRGETDAVHQLKTRGIFNLATEIRGIKILDQTKVNIRMASVSRLIVSAILMGISETVSTIHMLVVHPNPKIWLLRLELAQMWVV